MKKNFIDEMEQRGLIKDKTENIVDFKPGDAGYVGFDPTATSLHIGSLLPIINLTRLQKCGSKPIFLLGGFTGMIGDPKANTGDRKLLDEETLDNNLVGMRSQLEKFIDFDGKLGAQIVNNNDWLGKLTLTEFMRVVGKIMPLSTMLGKETISRRLESEKSISYTEFSYQLFQAYDFVHLYKSMNCTLQMGGSDQWGNITAGVDLVRKMLRQKAYAITSPLLTKSDGNKFGKTEDGNIWLDSDKTTPYKFYQFCLNVDDKLVEELLKKFTFLKVSEIDQMVKDSSGDARPLKKEFAKILTSWVHSNDSYVQSRDASELLFGKDPVSAIQKMSEDMVFQVFEDFDHINLSMKEYQSSDVVTSVAQLFNISKSEARRLVRNRAIEINGEKLVDEMLPLDQIEFINNKYLLVKKGKKHGLISIALSNSLVP